MTVKALETPEEQENTRKIVEDFATGDGPVLLELLVEYERQGREKNTVVG